MLTGRRDRGSVDFRVSSAHDTVTSCECSKFDAGYWATFRPNTSSQPIIPTPMMPPAHP